MTRTLLGAARRRHEGTVVYAVLGGVSLVLLLQWVLLSVAIEGYMAGHQELLVLATLASGLCLGLAFWLVRHVR